MFITIVASLACVCVVVLPAIAELRRIHDERHSPLRSLRLPTRRAQRPGDIYER